MKLKTVVQFNPKELETINATKEIFEDFCDLFGSSCTGCPLKVICDQMPHIKHSQDYPYYTCCVSEILEAVTDLLEDNITKDNCITINKE